MSTNCQLCRLHHALGLSLLVGIASEMAFREQGMMVFQAQLARRQGVVPMTRDYIMREEARLRGVEGAHRPPLRLAGE